MDITNQEVFDWYDDLADRNVNTVASSFIQQFSVVVHNNLSLFTKIKRLNKKVAQLKSRRNEKELERYLQSAFEIPIQESSHERALSAGATSKEKVLMEEVKVLNLENKKLKRKVDEGRELEEQYCNGVNCMKEVSEELKRVISGKDLLRSEIDSLREKYEKKSLELNFVF